MGEEEEATPDLDLYELAAGPAFSQQQQQQKPAAHSAEDSPVAAARAEAPAGAAGAALLAAAAKNNSVAILAQGPDCGPPVPASGGASPVHRGARPSPPAPRSAPADKLERLGVLLACLLLLVAGLPVRKPASGGQAFIHVRPWV